MNYVEQYEAIESRDGVAIGTLVFGGQIRCPGCGETAEIPMCRYGQSLTMTNNFLWRHRECDITNASASPAAAESGSGDPEPPAPPAEPPDRPSP